ncbi:acyl-CoA thioesterase [Paracoccus sanguinis]|uniref:acyl-CoA thioesterase n=1 Tax=Paracoccus sanguinis TaxID=1545044 RepID=UPI00051FCEAC|nr:thioesterase family protein [Paracoccus sanguinis]KGJ14729.1 thioesterase [Paracoccus sanguinis]
MVYRRAIPVEFGHCDPAGIVFYPRYLEFTNSVIEQFFAEAVGHSFRRIVMEEGAGVPTRHLEADYRAPSRLGDVLDFTLRVARLGRSSVTFTVEGGADGAVRFVATPTLVWVAPGGQPAPWPEAIRTRLAAYHQQDDRGAEQKEPAHDP